MNNELILKKTLNKYNNLNQHNKINVTYYKFLFFYETIINNII